MVEPLFTPEEYEQRLRRTRERMADAGHGLLLVADPANINYLTGYDAWSFYTPQLLAVPASGPVLLATRAMDATGVGLTTALSPDQVLAFPEDTVQRPDRHPMEWVAVQLRERGLGAGQVAVETDAYYFTPRAYRALQQGLPGDLVDANELVNWVRAIKSDAEIVLMRKAATIAERVMRTGLSSVRPGVRQCDVVAEIYRVGIAGDGDIGGDYTSFVPLLPTGEGTEAPHLTWSERRFSSGEGTILELAGCYRRYHCPTARTMYLGTPPKRLAETAEVVGEGLEAALEAVRPGVTCESVEAAWRAVIARHGLEKASRIGYSVGLGYPPDWGEHTMSLRPGDTSVLEPNMTFHMILGLWMDGWGYELSETFVVQPTGAECLTDIPRGLTVIS